MGSKTQLEVVGFVKDPSFHMAKSIAEGLQQKFPEEFLDPKIQPLFEFDWHNYLCNKKRELCGEVWQHSSSLMCFLNGRLLGDEKQLASWAENQFSFTFTQPQSFYEALAEDCYTRHLKETGHHFVFMDIDVAGEAVGRLWFELFSDVCPKTSKNFEALCTGERGRSESGLPLHYKGSLFHRIVPNGWVQGGDISPGSKGNGGESIYGPTFEGADTNSLTVMRRWRALSNLLFIRLPDESFAVSHFKRGVLGMANKGPHSNGSQFYITLQPTPWMDRTYVAFGQVIEGADILRKLEEATTCNERPKYECKVTACGVLKL
ncbi:probable inactive peptidyl-prolyl cis-trans isomerase-like 6 isoform X2 [Kryptolebias marmoratus]|uniref:probable inactive peptidyl-prolyl cis-trans isomerase-like 6 isoform X2 n=1 Tax=Kryptolebias marmoratus TaxID=37003 RepID=UPI000D52FBD8|nr:probable inactive peptidyl-prolyl cis-trans isomerase-like 6 isoform X2 [Kryptolebias marmoratus]